MGTGIVTYDPEIPPAISAPDDGDGCSPTVPTHGIRSADRLDAGGAHFYSMAEED